MGVDFCDGSAADWCTIAAVVVLVAVGSINMTKGCSLGLTVVVFYIFVKPFSFEVRLVGWYSTEPKSAQIVVDEYFGF